MICAFVIHVCMACQVFVYVVLGMYIVLCTKVMLSMYVCMLRAHMCAYVVNVFLCVRMHVCIYLCMCVVYVGT